MKGNDKNYSRHIYNLTEVRNSYAVFKLDKTLLQNVTDKQNAITLPVYIRTEINRGYNDTKDCDKWLRIKDADYWDHSTLVTGLRKTAHPEIFEGNFATKENGKYIPESLIIFQYAENGFTLVIDVFKDFYIRDNFLLFQLIQNHEYYFDK